MYKFIYYTISIIILIILNYTNFYCIIYINYILFGNNYRENWFYYFIINFKILYILYVLNKFCIFIYEFCIIIFYRMIRKNQIFLDFGIWVNRISYFNFYIKFDM